MKKFFLLSLIAGSLVGCNAGTTTGDLSANGSSDQQTSSFLPPLMGWSSWNTYGVNINEQLIKDQADAMVSQGLKDAGYMYINTDDGYFGWRDETGLMHAHPDRFPNGMKPVADYIHSLGLKAGIYSDAGVNTCGSMWSSDPKGTGAGLYGHEQQDMDLYMKEWGFDFIKIDYCGAQEIGLDEEKQYTAIHKAIMNTGRNDVSVNICRWAYPGIWAENIARSWRTTGDIYDAWESVRGILKENLYLSAFAGQGHYNDMDMLEVGRSLTPSEEEVHFGMWCIMSSPLLIGCDMTNIRPSSLDLLKNKELIALNQDPLGLQAYVAQRTDGDHYVMVKDIEKYHGNARAVAFYNPTDEEYTFNIKFADLELGGNVAVRDLVQHQDLSISEGSYSCTVAPHGVQICRMEAGERLEASSYEAEWAYLPCYNELGTVRKMINFMPDDNASGGMTVTNIGGRPENSIEWRNVYSNDGGNYDLTVYYTTPKDLHKKGAFNETGILPTVNGAELPFVKMEANTEGKFLSVTLPVTLNKGNNTISFTNPYYWAQEIDKITLARAK